MPPLVICNWCFSPSTRQGASQSALLTFWGRILLFNPCPAFLPTPIPRPTQTSVNCLTADPMPVTNMHRCAHPNIPQCKKDSNGGEILAPRAALGFLKREGCHGDPLPGVLTARKPDELTVFPVGLPQTALSSHLSITVRDLAQSP